MISLSDPRWLAILGSSPAGSMPMLYYLGQWLTESIGPMRLFSSYLFLAGAGTAAAALLAWLSLPRLWRRLPTDQGRAHAVGAEKSIGKPMSAGIIFVPMMVLVAFLFVPTSEKVAGVLICLLLAMGVGYFDDRSLGGWSEYRLGTLDLMISLLAAWILCGGQAMEIWLPIMKDTVVLEPWLYIAMATPLLWISINATNCSDGVDGLSASLTSMGILFRRNSLRHCWSCRYRSLLTRASLWRRCAVGHSRLRCSRNIGGLLVAQQLPQCCFNGRFRIASCRVAAGCAGVGYRQSIPDFGCGICCTS